MFGQDLDAMIEARNEQEWEDQNKEELPASGILEELGSAWDRVSEAFDHLAEAVGLAEGFPIECRIESVMNDLEDLQNEISKLKREVRR